VSLKTRAGVTAGNLEYFVIPAKAGIQFIPSFRRKPESSREDFAEKKHGMKEKYSYNNLTIWTPACAGVTTEC